MTPCGSRLRTTAALTFAPLMLLVLSGCSYLMPEASDPCSHLPESDSADGVGAEQVVMVDRSASLWQSEEGVLDLSEPLAGLLVGDDVYDAPGRTLITLGQFDGEERPGSTSTWEPPDTDTVEDRVEQERAEFLECVQEEYLPEALGEAPEVAGSDVLGGLADGETHFATGAEDDGVLRRLVVVTDGRSNTGCLDLTETGSDWAPATEVAEEAVDQCRKSGAWPEDDLEGVEVEIHLMMTAEEGDTRQGDTWLTDLWQEVCDASAASCTVERPVGVDGIRSGGGTDFPEDEPVTVPEWEEPCQVQELEGDLLFPHDSATARPEAVGLLDGLADHNRECASDPVTVTGHTDSQGDHDYNDDLSLDRAEYVAERLREHGFEDVTAEGEGKRDLSCPGDYDDNDDTEDPCPSANRRVVVEFSPEEV